MSSTHRLKIDHETGEQYVAVTERGVEVLKSPTLNKDNAFSRHERRQLGLSGLIPDHIDTIEQQLTRIQRQMDLKTTDLGRHVFLNGLLDRNVTLFYRYLLENLEDLVPIIYTPTVAQASRHWSHIFRRSRGLYITPRHRGRIREVLAARRYGERPIIVATDNERILGIGDQGAGGMGIPVGKLALYTAGAGIHPDRTVPVCLDVGTNNTELLEDPLYIGYRQPRLRGEPYHQLIAEFVEAVQAVHPGALLQWEDFANTTSFTNLGAYRDVLPSFNDDIQGTAAMAVGGLLASQRLTGLTMGEQRVVILGAGSAGIGIRSQVFAAMSDAGVAREKMADRILMLDSEGLVVADRPGLSEEKAKVAVPPETVRDWPGESWGLEAVVRLSGATVLIGVSGQAGAFTEEAVRSLANNCARPVVMPLSNPTSHSEATPSDVLDWSSGNALVATGSPFAPVNYAGDTHRIGQANNMFIFPGMGLGVLASRSSVITDAMFLAAAKALAATVSNQSLRQGSLFPSIDQVRTISRLVASAVFAQAISEGVAPDTLDMEAAIDGEIWHPAYLPYRGEVC